MDQRGICCLALLMFVVATAATKVELKFNDILKYENPLPGDEQTSQIDQPVNIYELDLAPNDEIFGKLCSSMYFSADAVLKKKYFHDDLLFEIV